jgi:hypothetical protein
MHLRRYSKHALQLPLRPILSILLWVHFDPHEEGQTMENHRQKFLPIHGFLPKILLILGKDFNVVTRAGRESISFLIHDLQL